jgi:hypothetical protein
MISDERKGKEDAEEQVEHRADYRGSELGQVPTAFHAATGIVVPTLNRYYVAVNHHGQTDAVVQVYELVP